MTRRAVVKGGLLGAGFVAGGLRSRSASAADVVTMRIGSDSPIGAPLTASAVKLKEMIEQQTGGRIKVTIFPDSQLGSNEAMSNSVKAGTLDAVMTDVVVMSASVPQVDLFNLPFLFPDTATTHVAYPLDIAETRFSYADYAGDGSQSVTASSAPGGEAGRRCW